MIFVFLVILSFVLTYIIRNYTIHKEFLDHPNDRSSHERAVPRTGGLAIIISFFVGLFYLYSEGIVKEDFLYAFLSSIPLIVISFLDDLFTLSARVRFFVQVMSVGLALHFIGSSSFVLNALFALGMLWLINLYNFLDGIDGYAVSEAVFVSFASYFIFGDIALLLLGVSALGFLPFNWQRASIFMGDVGSTFLGFALGVMVVYHAQTLENLAVWLILLAIFWADATWTLYRRFRSGQKITKAHKMHFFQRTVQSGFSHQRVVLSAMFLNVFSLFMIYFRYKSPFIYVVLAVYLIMLYFLAKTIDKRVPFK
jgi:Fuc2NAc and GlcNAc transferase